MHPYANLSRCLVLTILAWTTLLCTRGRAQFHGGNGDGFVAVATVQVRLDGVPAGVIALYRGGPGDGFDRAASIVTLDGTDLALLYGGGDGDGFDRAVTSLTLDGTTLALIYGGGDGDGFSRTSGNFTLSGQEITGLYGGGSGDGFDHSAVHLTLNGESITGLFGGGPGDGFDESSGQFTLGGAMLSVLYRGGSGDGVDHDQVALALDGTDLAVLYGGGDGDGFDVTLFAGSVPLPLTLISFAAFPEKDFVLLKWVTADEVDTDFFTIEKTRNGTRFAEVGDVPAAGFSEPGEELHYELRDEAPYDGTSFYRLKTTDFDGAISLSHLVEVEYSSAESWSFQLFPNPSTGQHFNLRPSGLEEGDRLVVEVLDATGRRLFTEEFVHGGTALPVRLASRLTAGSYLVRVGSPGKGFQAKILIVGGRF